MPIKKESKKENIEEIAAKFQLSTASIYNCLHQGKLKFDYQNLPDHNRRHQRSKENMVNI